MSTHNTKIKHWPFLSRFMRSFEVTANCWNWTGSIHPSGYARIGKDGKSHPAHRISWEIFNGKTIPKGLDVMHSCNNRACVNPAHLEPGTRAQNMAYMVECGRSLSVLQPNRVARGERKSNLKDEQVLEIRRLWNEGKSTGDQLGAMYGISKASISRIVLRQTWKHLP